MMEEIMDIKKIAENVVKKAYEDISETLDERIEMLDNAQEKLQEAFDAVEEAIKGSSSESNIKAYFLDHLKIMIAEGHGYLSNDLNIDKIKKTLQEESGESDED